MTDLGTLGGNKYISTAYGINDVGQVVGDSTTAGGDNHAFIIIGGRGMTDLGPLSGGFSYAHSINDTGQVAGWSASASTAGGIHAFITGTNGGGMTDLGTLGGDYSYALGINDAGQVVGVSSTTEGGIGGTPHAFITGPNGMGMTDLNSLVSQPGGVALTEAVGINNHGQVIALGGIPPIPEPETYAMFMAGLGLLGFIARRR
jgi:probable HAF family extracellular repeat protein